MAVDVFVAVFLIARQCAIRRERDRPTFTIIAPQQVAMRVTERRKEGLSWKGLTRGGFSSDAWAMTWAGGV